MENGLSYQGVTNMICVDKNKVNCADRENFRCGKQLFPIAKERGWWKEGPLDFLAVYGADLSKQLHNGSSILLIWIYTYV